MAKKLSRRERRIKRRERRAERRARALAANPLRFEDAKETLTNVWSGVGLNEHTTRLFLVAGKQEQIALVKHAADARLEELGEKPDASLAMEPVETKVEASINVRGILRFIAAASTGKEIALVKAIQATAANRVV